MAKHDTEESSRSKDRGEPPREYNPRSAGYSLICILSLALLATVTGVGGMDYRTKVEKHISISWAIISFLVSGLILLFDRVALLNKYFDLKNMGGEKKHVEGYVLCGFIVWWIVGVGYMTSPGNIAYEALNIYCMSWGCLYASASVLNEWASAKDIISVKELTRISLTLPSWYVLFLSSLVEMSSAANLYVVMQDDDDKLSYYHSELTWAITAGVISTVIAFTAILIQYKILRCCGIRQGGIVELGCSIFLVIWWVAVVSVMTEVGGVAATIIGRNCAEDTVPGSNLYLSIWISLISSINIVFRWNAGRAIQFAQTEERIFSDVTAMNGKIVDVEKKLKKTTIKVGDKLETVQEDEEL